MKKLLTISFAAFYLMTALGVTINVHKCMGQIASVKLFTDIDLCCCDKQNPTNECCDDTTVDLDTDQTIQIIQNTRVLFIGNDLHGITAQLPEAGISEKRVSVKSGLLDLPPPGNQPAWLLNCSLVFYG